MKINILTADGRTLTVTYRIHSGLLPDGAARFSVSAERSVNGIPAESASTPPAFKTKAAAKSFMTLLARNTVMPVHLGDVFSDYAGI